MSWDPNAKLVARNIRYDTTVFYVCSCTRFLESEKQLVPPAARFSEYILLKFDKHLITWTRCHLLFQAQKLTFSKDVQS